MKKLAAYLIIAALTTGFTWGKSTAEKCEKAKELAPQSRDAGFPECIDGVPGEPVGGGKGAPTGPVVAAHPIADPEPEISCAVLDHGGHV